LEAARLQLNSAVHVMCKSRITKSGHQTNTPRAICITVTISRISRNLTNILVLGHQPRRQAIIQLDLGDGVGLAQTGKLGGRFQAGGAREREAGHVGHCAGSRAEQGGAVAEEGGGFGEVGDAPGGGVHVETVR